MTVSDASTFLTKILDHKRTEVARQALKVPLAQLQANIAAAPAPRAFDAALRRPGQIALIAEVKKASPSKGVLVENFDPLALARTYAENGAAAISVLTDVRFFQGSLQYLQGIRALADRGWGMGDGAVIPSPIPVLRKDFILDAYQVYEARAYGADALLLIVAALEDTTLAELLALTHELGMQALVEVHDEAELKRALALGATLVGVNNRDLHTFVTSLETTRRLAARLPANDRPLLISESGIATAADLARVREWGVDAVLVGEALVTAADVAGRVRELVGATE
ncbi:MAG: indole-3-glycerol phosphate synthase TrpC [Chloroflexota bacterium]|nr:indole-3-glycerol phosphate synthase TrpC [Chloroflexota bacterium]